MRVALIGPVPPKLGGAVPGGVATHQVHLAAGLALAGTYAPLLATNTRVSPRAWRAAGGELEAAAFPLYRMAKPGWARGDYLAAVGPARAVRYALHLGRTRQPGSRRETLEHLLWYHRFLAEVRPDVIHVQHPLERCLYARMVRCLERSRTPLVVTAHSLFGEHPSDVIETLMTPNLRAAERVIAVSPHVAEQAIQLGVDPKRITVIRSGVDLDHFRPRERAGARTALEIGLDTPLVLFVGNLEPRKQVDILLQAMAHVHEQVPEARLIVVGSGESAGVQDQTSVLLRLTGELGLGDAVRFVGRIEDRQLLDWYAAADVFVLPSSSEAQGIVALEAMACGLPVVASAVGGLVGTIDNGRTGFLVPAGDVQALADGLLTLLRDEARRRALGVAARRAVERDFSWTRAVEATVEVYRDVIGAR